MGKWTALAEKTYKDIEKRKEERKKGKKEAEGFFVENISKIRRKQFHSRQNKFSRY